MKLNANRRVEGQLRGYDHFMNVVLENASDEETRSDLGQVVRLPLPPSSQHCAQCSLSPHEVQVIRGNAIVIIEAKDAVD